MYRNFSIKELAQLNQSIAAYLTDLPLQLMNEDTKEWRERMGFNWYFGTPQTESTRENWSRINIYCFTQMWGSTAGGWGGVGGCAMTEYYTVVIQNPFGMLAVFWSGRFAYAVEDDKEALKCLHANNFPALEPGHGLDKLKVIYKSVRK